MKNLVQNFKKMNLSKQAGLAALLTTILILAIGMAIALAISFIFLNEQKISRNFIKTAQAYYTAESGVEDSLYRIIKNKNYQVTNSLDMEGSAAAINISDASGEKIIQVSGDKDNRFRKLRVVLKTSAEAISFHYGVQVGAGGLTMSNDSQISGNVYSNGPVQGASGATITGDVWVASIPLDLNQQSTASDSDFIFGRISPQIDAAQSFTPSSSERLTKLGLYLKKSGSPGNKTIRILTDNGDKPSKTLVASGAYGTLYTSGISQSDYSWVDVTLNTPPNLVAGTKYWIAIDTSADSGNYFWWGRDSTDAYSGGTGKYSANWNASNPVWSPAGGDLGFKIWLGGMINTLSGMAVGNDAHANTISSCSIIRDAYFQTISGTTVGGTQYPDSPDPSMENMPISDSEIADWKADAAAGGVISGDYNLTNSAIASLGPKKINGNLNISNEADLTITGTVYVTGNINISNRAKIRLAPSYGDLSGVLLTDGSVSISNDSVFYNNGAGTYLLLLSTKSGTAMDIANDVNTMILYASQGAVNVSNYATLKELTAYSVNLSYGAQVIYESGLASAKFSSGPGGTWVVDSWREE